MVLVFSKTLFANIPEPDTIIFGQINGKVGSLVIPITDGSLEWEIKSFQDANISYTFETDLKLFSDNNYSYALKIPQQIFSGLETLLKTDENTLIFDSEEKFLRHTNISVNGNIAQIRNEDIELLLNSENRSLYKEINLTVELPFIDEDNDGLPSQWEEMFGLSDSNFSDAEIDSDFDGISNADEYKYGLDPNTNNSTVQVLSENSNPSQNGAIVIFEGSATQINNLKVVGLENKNYSFNIVSIPQNLEIQAFTSGTVKQLAVGDTVYTEDIFIFKDTSFLTNSNENNFIGVILNDTANNQSIDLNITYSVKKLDSIAKPHRWIDGKSSQNLKTDELNGRSGNSFDNLIVFQNDGGWTKLEENDTNIININSQGFINTNYDDDNDPETEKTVIIAGLEQSTDENKKLSISENGSIFSIFSSLKQNQTIFHGNNIEIGIQDSYLNLAKVNQKGLFKSTVDVQNSSINLLSIEQENQNSAMFLNSVFVGGSKSSDSEYLISKSPIISFGKIDDWQSIPFDGYIGEFLLFNEKLDSQKKWLVNAYLLSKWKGYILVDYSQTNTTNNLNAIFTNDKYILLGGNGDDNLTGGNADDILIGSLGADNLRGYGGSDIFVVGNGDHILDLAFEDNDENKTILEKDILDITHLLKSGDENLYSCVFIKPVENKKATSKVKINKNCSGRDSIYGADYTDYYFYVTNSFGDLSINNSHIAKLWKTGVLKTGNHKPQEIEASISINQLQEFIATENNNMTYSVEINFKTSEYFQFDGTNNSFKIPLKVTGTATDEVDFVIISNETNLTKVENSDTDIIYLPLEYAISQDYKVSFDVLIKEDETKEEIENINIELMPVPEYFNVDSEKNKIQIEISNGLDRVSIERVGDQNVTEGENIYFIVRRSGSIDSRLEATIEFRGTTNNGLDFEFTEQKIVFEAGETEKTIPLAIVQDGLSEEQEIIEVALVSSSDYQIDDEDYQTIFYVTEQIQDNVDSEEHNASILEIYTGWNLVAIDTNLKQLPTQIALVWQYSDGAWSGYSNNQTLADKLTDQNLMITNDTISSDLGTWFLSQSDLNITVTPLELDQQVTKISVEKYGWNLVGTKTTLPTSSISCDYGMLSSVWKYDNKNGWLVYDPLIGAGVIENSFDTVRANEGFWVICK
jgi:hypothetical protein